ncbi:phosphotransferase [Acetobacter musti]|uniref:Phosphotransferase n=1 Tax=Acetobacter musti TaxID=864732 RepID=A0ABX0JUC8_9PROT|nr:phosphotransferase [Acetobacter musti]NHN86434.1 phosphotransferase [Acetobacter musti]
MNDTHYAHGLGNDLKRPDWPGIRLAELDRVLSRFPCAGRPQNILWHSPRPFSAAAEVKTTCVTLFVKRHHHRVRSIADLAEEHRFISHLRQKDFPVVNILTSENGETSVVDDIWVYEVQEAGRGLDLYRNNFSWTAFACSAHAFSAGRTLAKFHEAAKTFQAPSRQTKLLVANYNIFGSADPIQSLRTDLVERPALARFLEARSWEKDLNEYLIGPYHQHAYDALRNEPPLWTHGDWHGSNLLWSSSGDTGHVTTVLDFGLSDRTFALFDLCTAIERNLISWLDAGRGIEPVCDFDQLDALLAGYGSISFLSSEMLYKISALLPLVHADFALSEIEYFSGILMNDVDALVAYERYLLGHAIWFRQTEGKKLIYHLNTFADGRHEASK